MTDSDKRYPAPIIQVADLINKISIYAEAKGTGISTMRKEIKKTNPS